MSWSDDGTPTAMDLYYDPVVDVHHGHGPGGLLIPGWYLAPQRRDVAEAAWKFGAMLSGALGDGPMNPLPAQLAGQLVQMAGEFADPDVKARIWSASDDGLEPTWDRDAGEFTFGFGLGEEHPRGQMNARAMAGWVCTTGAWSNIFNAPNLAKFDQPTVVDVDFPRVAMSVAHYDGRSLHLAASPQNASVRDTRTSLRLTNLDGEWVLERPDGQTTPVAEDGLVELTVDGSEHRARRSD
jgi:hypothetical protein